MRWHQGKQSISVSVSYALYTDGSCPGNPGVGGTGVFVIVENGEENLAERRESKGYLQSNNQRMELRAGIDGLRLVRRLQKEFGYGRTCWYTDSKYITNHMTSVPRWKKGGLWTTSEGKPVANAELWTDLETVRSDLRIYPTKIDRENNKEADKLARLGARNPGYTDFGYNPGRIGKSVGGKGKATSFYSGDHENLRIRVFQVTGQIKKSDLCKVKFELVYEDGSISEDKYDTLVHIEIESDLHRTYEHVVNIKGGRILEIVETNWSGD